MDAQIQVGLAIFGKLVRQARLDSGLSQRGFARQLGISFDTLKHWEQNADAGIVIREPSFPNLVKVAPHLTDPRSGKPFDPMDLFALCQGKLEMPEELLN